MGQTKLGSRSPSKEALLGFVLGSVGGCILGITEHPVDRTLSVMTAEQPLKPLIEEVRAVGALGLGTLMGATALTTAMTSLVAGVILAAAVASLFVATRSCNGSGRMPSRGVWAAAGLAAAFGTTISGATLGFAVEWIVMNGGMVWLLMVLGVYTALKLPLHFLLTVLWKQGEACCALASVVSAKEKAQMELTESEQRQRVTAQVEERILALEKGGGAAAGGGLEQRKTWVNERQQREELERKKAENEESELEQRTIQDWINTMVVKHVDVLAFAGIPMTVLAVVTSGFGLLGYGNHQLVLIVLLILVALIAYLLLNSDFTFWMLVGCVAMLATFVIAMLTLHAGQTVVRAAVRTSAKGHRPSREKIGALMSQQSSLEALNTAFFAAKLSQLALGAAVGGPLIRRGVGEVHIIVGAALVAGGLLAGVEVLAPALSEGAKAGALLGVVGATGVSVGGASALAGRWSSWPGTLGTVVGLAIGALGLGKWHIVNIGLQVPVAYVFAQTNPF